MEDYGKKTIHDITFSAKHLLTRAVQAIRKFRRNCIVQEKKSSYKTGKDFLTNADTSTQNEILRCCIESFGENLFIVAEETKDLLPDVSRHLENQDIESCKIICVLDPIDGTKSFMNNETGLFGPMFTLMTNEYRVLFSAVVSAWPYFYFYYRDSSTNVAYYVEPDQPGLGSEVSTPLPKVTGERIEDDYIYVRDGKRMFLDSRFPLQKIIRDFKGIDVIHGGFGLSVSHLWKQMASAFIFRYNFSTPWDMIPPLSISYRLGYETFAYDFKQQKFVPRKLSFELKEKKIPREEQTYILIAHPNVMESINKNIEKK